MPAVGGLVCFDLDGTLLRGLTVCEVIAEALGRLDEMKRFERFTSEAEITAARTEMARWYADQSVSALCDMCERAQLAPGANDAVSRLQSAGIEVAIASITWSFAVGWFAQKLNVRHYLGTALRDSGEIDHVWGRTKGPWLRNLASDLAMPEDRIAAVGDSKSDAELLRAASLRFFVGLTPPDDVPAIIHLPDADLQTIADRIIESWTN